MQKALDSYLTFENIPIRQTRIFNLKTSEGHYNCWAAAWNADWICGFITKGSSAGVFDAYHFMRFVSQGADTVLKKLGSNDVSLTFTLSSSTSGSWQHDQYRYGNWSGSNSTTVTITCADGEVTVENGALSYGVSANNGSGRGYASVSNVLIENR